MFEKQKNIHFAYLFRDSLINPQWSIDFLQDSERSDFREVTAVILWPTWRAARRQGAVKKCAKRVRFFRAFENNPTKNERKSQ
ncbi:hypothetical protein [Paraburkholderia xenovorans]|uniref:hypothetical protein n=1 Tax=Paraburkholderia xenovorans TaxID=36873 RepID=UPI0015C52EB9|nr:hypothetical protein [Paraburkholderia xenovorans]NPT35981.1 hypothetical protein [Paraburkholderia xenovorans]